MSILPDALIGCLLDVSGSMSRAFGPTSIAEAAVDRLHAVFGAALQLAEAERQRDTRSLMFVAAFGLKSDCPPVVDLCGIAEVLLAEHGNGPSGHHLLVRMASQRNLDHITEFIEERLTETEARIVHDYLQRHPEQIAEFIDAIPSPTILKAVRRSSIGTDSWSNTAFQESRYATLLKTCSGINKASKLIDEKIDTSKALRLARKICVDWLRGYQAIRTYQVDKVVDILGRVYELFKQTVPGCEVSAEARNVVSTLQRYIYGATPMRAALTRAITVFEGCLLAKRRMLVLISDGASTDGDPRPVAHDLHSIGVTVATVYVTNDENIAGRRFYDQSLQNWTIRQRTLFEMASKVPGVTHPIPVLASAGWDVPVSGECALYAVVSCTTALNDFCSILASGHFGSTENILDAIGRVAVDAYVNDQHIRVFNDPSDQNKLLTCYAHATAAAISMALSRIVGRKEGYPTIIDIRKKIIEAFPAASGVRDLGGMLDTVLQWYRPLQYRKVDETGARQAVLRRRPVLSSFFLSNPGWTHFSKHFKSPATHDTVLTLDEMMPHRRLSAGGGHAVVMTGCSPTSITFLNSWGYDWGRNGSFSVEDYTVLEVKQAPERDRVCFYDIFWFESGLDQPELDAYFDNAQRRLSDHAREYPSLFNLEVQCPLCRASELVGRFQGNVRQATCPSCLGSFKPEAEHLLRALEDRPGLMAMA